MTLDSALPTGDSVQNLRYPMANVIPHYIADEQSGQQDTHNRIDQVQPVHTGRIEVLRQEVFDIFYQELQQTSRQSRQDTYHETKYQDEVLVLYLLFPPQQQALEKTFLIIHILILL